MRRRTLLAVAFACAPSAGWPAGPGGAVHFGGDALQAPRTFGRDELAAQPAALHGSFARSRGSPGAEVRSIVRGVRLAPLLESLGLTPRARADWKNLLVTVTATDGYRAHFTWVELTNTPVGDGVLLLFERDGQPLEPREGAIALLSTADHRLGARHVRNVLRVEVRRLPD